MKTLMYIRNSRLSKVIAILLVLNLVVSSVYTPSAYALTSGPSQPEASQFMPIEMTDLVDPFTGDFSYNIPLMDIGGYPINLTYNSNIGMDQEASWAGLGWNVNIGAITRAMRGLPDDFQGDKIVKRYNIKPNVTHGIALGFDTEYTGYDPDNGKGFNNVKPSVDIGFVVQHNNYDGFSIGQSFNVGLAIAQSSKNQWNIGLGLSSDQNGLNISPNLSYSARSDRNSKTQNHSFNLGLGLNINSRTGIGAMTLDGQVGFGKKGASECLTQDRTFFKKTYDQLAKGGRGGVGFGGSLRFSTPTYTPQHTFPFTTYSFGLELKAGGSVKWVDIGGKIRGFGAMQKTDYNQEISPAYGYCYSQEGQGNLKALHDFNREKDGSFTPNIQYLPVTNYTYDIFQINAQGLGGNFRAYRNDFGYLYDIAVNNNSDDANLSAEANVGDIVDIGINFQMIHTDSDSRLWEDSKGNLAAVNTKFQKKEVNTILEPFTFRLVGDMGNTRSVEQYERLGRDKPVRIDVRNDYAESGLVDQAGNKINLNGPRRLTQRQVRTTSIEYLSVGEVKTMYPHLAAYIPGFAPDHHIGAIIITAADGTRYVFGLPAYNRIQKEITFSVSNQYGNVSIDPVTRHVSYTPADNSIGNTKGIDNYFEEITTGPYVHTWMLTEVLSPDYVDYTGDGPTLDDLGTYTKFTYGHYNELTGKYYPNLVQNWRTPVDGVANTATYYEGLKSDGFDDKANIIYGQKDVWYVRTIESKNHVALFELEERRDAFGVSTGAGTNAARGGSPLYRLSRIHLFSKKDYDNLLSGLPATPIKTVHLVHNYALCPNVPNNDGQIVGSSLQNLNAAKGKLTLKQVYFTYEKSGRAKFSPYTFDYDETNNLSPYSNPAYKSMEYDRWGNYKPEPVGLKNIDYPYTEQDKNLQDKYSSAWCLRKIFLPSGGQINIEYESDDYAYVQDKEASRMFMVLGVSDYPNDATYAGKTTLYDVYNPHGPCTYLYFRLEKDPALGDYPDPGTVADMKEYVYNKYLLGSEKNTEGPSKYLYFRFLTNLNEGLPGNALEYVSGYAEMDYSVSDYCGALVDPVSGKYEVGWIKINTVDTGDDDGNPTNGDAHPISKAAWQFSRIHTPRYAFNQPAPNASFGEAFLDHMVNSNIIVQLIQMFKGVNQRMKESGYGSYFAPNTSWIRLMDPDGIKLGGGSRVKQIQITDSWETITYQDSPDMVYAQSFEYRLDDNRSSGVAEWEPVMGGDENIHRKPTFYDVAKTLVNDDRFYQEKPMGESFFPAPSVGYSKVTVKNMVPDPLITTNATGKTIYEFYTARDFPTFWDATPLMKIRDEPDPFAALMGWSYDHMTVGQGYVIEINDMHGKIRQESVYQEGKSQPITRKIYKYKTAGLKKLSSLATVITPEGQLKDEMMGVDFDIIADYRESNSAAFNANIAGNIGLTSISGPPGLLISGSVFPKVGEEVTRFRSAVVTKVIRRAGLLDTIQVYDLGAKIETHHAAYDQMTGQVLLTQVNNAYNDERYALTIPAYWAYSGMSMASQNWGFEFDTRSGNTNTNWNRSTGQIMPGSTAEQYLHPGDELIKHYVIQPPAKTITAGWNLHSSHLNRAWVIQDDDGTLWLADHQGNPVTTNDATTNFRFKVIRSGRKNMPLQQVQTVESFRKPVENVGSDVFLQIDQQKKILNATAVEYSDIWRTHNKLDRFPRTDLEIVKKCAPDVTSYAFTDLLNKLLSENIFIIPSLVLNRDHEVYGNTVKALFSNNCIPFYAAGVSTSTPITAYAGHTTVHLSIFQTCNGEDNKSCQMSLTCVEDPGSVPTGRIQDIIHWEIVTAIPPVPTFTGPYQQMTVPYDLLLMATFSDGNTALFVLKNPGPDDCIATSMVCGDYPYLPETECQIVPGDTVNPYVLGILGSWRPRRQYTFVTERDNAFTGSSHQMNMRTDGTYNSFETFWKRPTSPGHPWDINTAHIGNHNAWKWVTEITNYSPYGFEAENKDALGIYSAAVYGYQKTLPIAVASNAKYKELGYDGFEDYDGVYECYKDHFKFDMHEGQITSREAHTGRYSMRLANQSPVSMIRKITPYYASRTGSEFPFLFSDNDHLGLFSPDQSTENKTFILSFWIKREGYGYQMPYIHDYNNPVPPNIRINGVLLGTPPVLKRKTEIIEGWQMYEFEFTIGAGSTGDFSLAFENAQAVTYYLDDVRVYPVDATMKSFVYDARTLYYMAELDENNFATFYEYDEDGSLIRVKKETERGIMTIRESRGKMHKSNTMQ